MSKEVKSILSLSPMQAGMLFLHMKEPESLAYIEVLDVELKGNIDKEILYKVFQLLIERNEVLRTSFIFQEVNKPVQVILNKREGLFDYKDIRHLPKIKKQQYIDKFLKDDARKGFNLTKDTLIRMALFQIEDYRYHLVVTHHHIIMDGWSIGLLFDELIRIYVMLRDGKTIDLMAPISYSRYIKWLEKLSYQEGKFFWLKYLNNFETVSIIPFKKHYKKGNYDNQSVIRMICADDARKLAEYAKELKVTLNSILQTIWAILLQKYNSSDDVVFGNVISGRSDEIDGIESIIGLFINTIPLRVTTKSKQKFRELVQEIQRKFKASEKYGYLSLADIQKCSEIEGDLFDNIFTFENYPVNINSPNDIFEICKMVSVEETNYDFNITLNPVETGIRIKFDYNRNMFETESVEKIADHFESIIKTVLKMPDIEVRKIELMSVKEKQIVMNFNSKADFFSDRSIYQFIEYWAQQTPDKVAVCWKNETITYSQLNVKTNQIAHYLSKQGFQPEQLGAILLERSSTYVMIVLAIWKLGGAYIPIDIEFPEKRILSMAENADFLITVSEFASLLFKKADSPIIIFLDEAYDKINTCSKKNLNIPIDMSRIAYVIYTSGSTGTPKGAMVEHLGMMNNIQGKINDYNLNQNSIIVQNASSCFDISVWQFFASFVVGGKTCIYTKSVIMDVSKFVRQAFEVDKATVLEIVPSYLSVVLDKIERYPEIFKTLNILSLTGEAIKPDLLNRWFSSFPMIKVINAYGPAEASDDITHQIFETPPSEDFISIGKPIPNNNIYIVDQNMNLVPIGVIGEIVVSGVGVGRGYLNDPERTKLSFIIDPFKEKTTRMYKTGDLGAWREDGSIIFFGRKDYQVKINGFRIELGEIENCLVEHVNIEEAVVLHKTSNSNRNFLCAYLVAKTELFPEEIQHFVSKSLPYYMVPSLYIQLKVFPRLHSGKINRHQLLKHNSVSEGFNSNFEQPETETEKTLVKIWKHVLSLDEIGINQDFFSLGGHSISAISMTSLLKKELGLELPIFEVFSRKTISKIGMYIDGINKKEFKGIHKAPERKSYVLSSQQQRLFALQLFDQGSINYNMPGVFRLKGDIDVIKLNKAFKALIKRHEVLRTSFITLEDKTVQVVHKNLEFSLSVTKISNKDIFQKIIEFTQPFNLSKPPLLRAKLEKGENDSILYIDIHHIVSDGISEDILINEISHLYNGETLENVKLHYKDYAEWQRSEIGNSFINKQAEYWNNLLSSELPVLDLLTDFPRPSVRSFEGAQISFELSLDITEQIKKACHKQSVTLFMFLLTAYSVFLSKCTDQEDIIVGTPVSGRRHTELESVVGMFVNTLPIRSYPVRSKRFQDYLHEVKDILIGAYENQSYPFEEMVENVDILRDISRNPIFDTMFVLQNTQESIVKFKGISVLPYSFDHRIAKFDLTLGASEIGGQLKFELEYSTALFKKETAIRFCKHYKNVILSILPNIEKRISEIEIVSENEKNEILEIFNKSFEPVQEKSVYQFIEEQAARQPDQIAIVFNDERITFKQFNEKANQLAYWLKEQNIGPNDFVGLYCDRSLEVFLGIYGILKSGGAYLPISPEWPMYRVENIIKETQPKVLLIQSKNTKNIIQIANNVIPKNCTVFFRNIFKDPFNESIDKKIVDLSYYSTENPKDNTQLSDLAYIIFTSGTTREPKGVLTPRRALINLIEYMKDMRFYEPGDRASQLASYVFDGSVIDIFGPICSGASVFIASNENFSSMQTLVDNFIIPNQLTNILISPSLIKQLLPILKYKKNINQIVSIKTFLFGGESLDNSIISDIKDIFSNQIIRFINLYGPTETSVFSTNYIFEECPSNKKGIVPIGYPIKRTKILILNQSNNLCPFKTKGKIFIGGEGLSIGYYKDIKKTKEKFIVSPIETNEILYDTGDLGYWTESGNIEILGRVDNQVKIRGYRIEIGELESSLLSCQFVNDVVIVVKNNDLGDKVLCAYVVGSEYLNIAELRNELKLKIPEYMIPSFLVKVDYFKLTQSSKIDLKSLPEPTIEERYIVEPKTKTEKVLVSIFKKILNLEKVSVMDNFFDLGGHSLKAMNISAQVEREFEVKLQLVTIFKAVSLKALAEFIDISQKTNFKEIPQAEKCQFYPTSKQQKRLFALQYFNPESTAYNILGVFKIKGALNVEKLKWAFQTLFKRHEILRTSFCLKDGEPVQIIHSNAILNFFYQNISKKQNLENFILKKIKTFDLKKAPLIRLYLFKRYPKEFFLMVDVHHIIADGVSMSILVHELTMLYKGITLEPITLQYKDYACWQNSSDGEAELKKQKKYWLNEFSAEIPILNLPLDFERPKVQSFEGNFLRFVLNPMLTQDLIKFCRKHDVTLYMFLLTVFGSLLSRYASQEVLIIGSPIAGRIRTELENMVGIFSNTLALKLNIPHSSSFQDVLLSVKQRTIEAFENQDYPFEQLVEEVNTVRDIRRNPLFDVFFAFQDMEKSKFQLDDVQVDNIDIELKNSKFDLSLNAWEKNSSILYEFEYCTKLFTQPTIQRMGGHLRELIQAALLTPQNPVGSLNFLIKDENKNILTQFNSPINFDPPFNNIYQFFENKVNKVAFNKIAIEFANKKITWKEIQKKVENLAAFLVKHGVRRNVIVALLIERSIEMVIGILGILKAGGAYLPIDPDLPKNRILYILKDSRALILLTQPKFIKNLDFSGLKIDLTDSSLYKKRALTKIIDHQLNDLAYLIYTSGSTGMPKGVMVEHQSIINTLLTLDEYYPIQETDAYLMKTNYAFDVSLTEIFGWYFGDGKLVILPAHEEKCTKSIVEAIEKYNITHLNFSPSMFSSFLVDLQRQNWVSRIDSLKYIFVAGEAFTTRLVKQINELRLKAKVENIYGPTELSIYSSYFSIKNYTADQNMVPIGKPLKNLNAYIINSYNMLQPIGIPGELCFGGTGLARGYCNLPDLTKEFFTSNPFRYGERMYHTGDLAKWLPSGDIQYLGRLDNQVKIRGFRIELTEIEAILLRHNDINEAAVITKILDDTIILWAYFSGSDTLTVEKLYQYLKNHLPYYMIPSYFTRLESFPLNSSGKINRKALIDIDTFIQTSTTYEPAVTEMEKKLYDLWKSVLNTDGFGINDDFFHLGGHSLIALQLVSLTEKNEISLSVNDIFNYSTIKSLAQIIENRTAIPLSKTNSRIVLIEQFCKQFKCKATILSIILNNISYDFLFVDDRQKSILFEDIIIFLSLKATGKITPHYVLLFSSAKLSSRIKNLKWGNKLFKKIEKSFPIFFNKINNAKIKKMIFQIENENEEQRRLIRKQHVTNIYKFSATQKNHLTIKGRTSVMILYWNQCIDMLRFSNCLLSFINQQNLFRSQVIIKDGEPYWQEFSQIKSVNYKAPFLDISFLDPKYQKKFIEKLGRHFKNKEYYETIPYSFIVLRKNLREHLLIFSLDHIIYDQQSYEIIKNFLIHNYKIGKTSQIIEPRKLTYQTYIKLINKGPIDTSVEEIIKHYRLRDYCKVLQDCSIKLKPHRQNRIFDKNFKIGWKDLLRQFPATSPWELAFQIFVQFCSRRFNLEHLPVSLMSYGRKYGEYNFFEIVGEFVDHIPLLIDVNGNLSYEEIENKLSFASNHYVNFITLLSRNKNNKSEYSKIATFLSNENINYLFDSFLFNFQGKYSSKEQLIKNNILTSTSSSVDVFVGFSFEVTYNDEFLFVNIISPFKENQIRLEFLLNDIVDTFGKQVIDENIIDVQNLCKRYPKVVAVDDVTFSVKKGYCFGILGPNGAGKTTLIELIEGVTPITSGKIKILGFESPNELKKIQPQIGVQLQENSYFQFLSLGQLLNFFIKFHQASKYSKKGLSQDEILELVSLKEKKNEKIVNLSGGQKQRFSIGLSLIGDPEILFLDEPTSSLDPQNRRKIWEFVKTLKENKNKTIILTTHFMEEAELLCDELMIMDHGKIIARGHPLELISSMNKYQRIIVSGAKINHGDKIKNFEGVVEYEFNDQDNEISIFTNDSVATMKELISYSEQNKINFSGFYTVQANLEDVFLHITGKGIRE